MACMAMAMARDAFGLNTVLHFLELADLPIVRVVSCDIEATISEGRVWLAAAKAALPGFEFAIDQFRVPRQRQFAALAFSMVRAGLTQGSQAAVERRVPIDQLCNHVMRAREAAASHPGGGASYLAARMRFPDERMIDALDKVPQASHTSFARSIVIPRGSGTAPLRLHFALRDGILYMAARDDDMPTESISAPSSLCEQPHNPAANMALDVKSADANVLMHYRGLPLSLNEPWKPALSGMLSFAHGKPAAARALAAGVLCVLCVRPGAPKASKEFAHYLNLDKV